MILLLKLVWPGLVVLFGLFVASLAGVFWTSEVLRNGALILAAIILGIGFGWTIWTWIDWGNDYYVVTNQRVVWIEVVIGLYESRNEAPMNATALDQCAYHLPGTHIRLWRCDRHHLYQQDHPGFGQRSEPALSFDHRILEPRQT